MLVIGRRIGESLFIGDDIEVEVLGVCGAQIRIGINAPREVLILRSEVRLTAEANRLAAQHASPALLAAVRLFECGQPGLGDGQPDKKK